MATKKNDKDTNVKRPPANSLEDQENRMISLSMSLVEKRLEEGTASSQESTHFLKLGSTMARLEREKLKHENELLKARTEQIQASKELEKLFQDAIRAFTDYRGGHRDSED